MDITLNGTMRTLLVCAALASTDAFAFPQGTSYWVATGKCNSTCRAEGNVAGTAQIIVIIRGNHVCGEVQQDYGAAYANRSPNGKIAGRLVRGAAIVGYTDSFADPKYPGIAHLHQSAGQLRWTDVMRTPSGYLHLHDFSFHQSQQLPIRFWREGAKEEISRSCAEYFEDSGNNPARDYLLRE